MPNPPAHQRLFAELKRRRVFRVMAVYGVVGFVVLQVVDLALPALLLPDWTYRLIALILLIGFPVAIVLTWAFELTPEGVQRTRSATAEEIEATVAAPAGRRWPIGIAALAGTVLLVLGAWWVLADPDRTAGAAYDSIAVLPFVNMTGDSQVEYLGDGIADELRNALVGIGGVSVPSMTSAAAFKGSGADIRTIGDSLGVQLVLEGSVRGTSDRLRVTAQLIDARSGYHVWQQSYDRPVSDLLDLQDELTGLIVDALVVELDAQDESELLARGTESTTAYDLYLQGRYFWNKRTLDDIRVAIGLFEEAIEVDSSYAPAYAAIADAYAVPTGWGDDPAHALDEAVRYADLALDLDPTLAQAHTALAYAVMMRDLDFRRAEDEFARALELDPDYPTAHQWRAELLSATGRHDEAVRAARTAESLDPTLIIRWNLARVLYFAGHYKEAIAQAEPVAAEGATHSDLARLIQIQSSYMLEDYESIVSLIREIQEAPPQATGRRLPGAPRDSGARAGGGEFLSIPSADDVPRFLVLMFDTDPGSADRHPRDLQVAAAVWTRVDADTALARLAALASDPDDPAVRAVWFEVLTDPIFDALRGDPRYEELNARFGL
jgi:TolB-like protein/Flp pilus assembly protein TadD